MYYLMYLHRYTTESQLSLSSREREVLVRFEGIPYSCLPYHMCYFREMNNFLSVTDNNLSVTGMKPVPQFVPNCYVPQIF